MSSAQENLHPIALEAARLLVEENGVTVLGQDAVERLSASLDALKQSPDLKHAIASLADLAAHLHRNLKSEAAATKLLELASSAVPALVERKLESNDAAAAAATRRFQEFASAPEARRAPLENEPAPPNTFKAGTLPKGRI